MKGDDVTRTDSVFSHEPRSDGRSLTFQFLIRQRVHSIGHRDVAGDAAGLGFELCNHGGRQVVVLTGRVESR